MPATYYPAIIDRSASGFGITFPDFPGVSANGDTISAACLSGEQALGFHIEAMAKDKDDIPEPSDLEAIEDVEGADDVARVMIRADVPLKVERVLVSIDSNLLRSIDAVATNRSAFLADAARAALRNGSVSASSPIVGYCLSSELKPDEDFFDKLDKLDWDTFHRDAGSGGKSYSIILHGGAHRFAGGGDPMELKAAKPGKVSKPKHDFDRR